MATPQRLHLILTLLFLLSTIAPGAVASSRHEHEHVRIVGGGDTPIEKIPYQASIQRFWRHICGGAIVSERWLVTAAHCISMLNSGSHIGVGIRTETAWNIPFFGWMWRRHLIAEALIHPNASLTTVDYDIGVIRIDGEFGFGAKVQATSIPLTGESYLSYDNLATVSGWGREKEGANVFAFYLQSVQVPLMLRKKCAEIYENGTRYRVTNRMLCAAGIGKGSPCQGDSGGPLVLRDQLIGLVSWGMLCNDDKYPSVFTNLLNNEIRQFIKEKTGV